jgi:hypothetical protein
VSLTRDGKLKLLFVYLVLSAASARAIPFLIWGADFHNLQVYQTCAHDRSAYLISGEACGDKYQRDMIYPPLMLHSFGWTRALTLEKAMYIWSALVILMTAVVYYAWSRLGERVAEKDRGWEVVVFCALLTLQAPFVFLMERGGTDLVPIVLWSGATYLFQKKRLALAGALAGTAAAFKLYPVIPCVVVTAGLLASAYRGSIFRKMDAVRFGGGAFASFVALNLAFLSDARIYYSVTLPRFSKYVTAKIVWSHSVRSFAGEDHVLYWALLSLLFLALWSWSAGRALAERPAMAFAGVLSMSTFFAGTTWDYNLVTTFPLLLMLFLAARRSNRWGTLVFGVVAIVGDRALFTTDTLLVLNPTMHLALELAWLVWVAIELAELPAESATAALV